MTSLRRQLARSLLGTLTVVLLLAGVALHLLLADSLVAEFDAALLTRARALGALMEADGPYIEFDYNRALMPEFAGDDLFQLWPVGGESAFRSDSLGEHELPRITGDLLTPERFDLELPDGRRGRGLGVVVRVVPDDESPEGPEPPLMQIVVARARDDLDARLVTLDTSLALTGLLVLALLTLGVRRALGRGLAPLAELGARVDAVQVATLGQPLAAADTPDELRPFLSKLDELMERLAAAFARQRRMTDAMAHELRTPVAELRSASDVARAWPDDDELGLALADTAAEVALRMSSAIEAILHTSRLEAGADTLDAAPLDLAALVQEHWSPWQARGSERGVQLDSSLEPGLEVVGDRRLLGLVLSNLLGNAASFSGPGALVVEGWVEAGALRLRLSNPVEGLTAADVTHLEEPFWRKDAARSGGRHSGLGLTLVRAILTSLAGQARFSVEGGLFVATVDVPAPSSGRNPTAPGRG